MNSDDAHDTKKLTPTPDGGKETTIGIAAKDPVRQMVGDKIREFLDGPTVVIWGSGATMPLGFPSMGKLLDEFSRASEFSEIQDIHGCGFEEKLSKLLAKKGSAEREVYEDRACQIIGELFHKVEQSNQARFPCSSSEAKEYFQAMLALHSFLSAQPGIASKKSVDILTTNYDCSWELLFKQNGIRYLDGFSEGQTGVDYTAFFPKEAESVTRLVKVHGSDNWFRYRTNDPSVEKVGIGELPSRDAACMVPKIIIPSNLKYQGVSTDMTFSNLMLTFGRLIKEAKSYLTIGFGFNDNHLTPLLKQEAQKGKPVVRLMKEVGNGGKVFEEGVPRILTIYDGSAGIDNPSEILFQVFKHSFLGESEKARFSLSRFATHPERNKGIVWLERLFQEIGEKEYSKAIDTILHWKQETEKGKVRMTSVCWRENGKPASRDVFDDALWSLPSFVKLLTDKRI